MQKRSNFNKAMVKYLIVYQMGKLVCIIKRSQVQWVVSQGKLKKRVSDVLTILTSQVDKDT